MIQKSTSFEPSCPENLLRRGYGSSQKANKRYHSLHGIHDASGSHQDCFRTTSRNSFSVSARSWHNAAPTRPTHRKKQLLVREPARCMRQRNMSRKLKLGRRLGCPDDVEPRPKSDGTASQLGSSSWQQLRVIWGLCRWGWSALPSGTWFTRDHPTGPKS